MLRTCLWLCCFISVVAYADPDPGIRFIENKKQWKGQVQYAARVSGGSFSLLPGKFRYVFLDQQRIGEIHDAAHHGAEPIVKNDQLNGVMIEVAFEGANQKSEPMPFGKFSEYYNYFLGNDPSSWSSAVAAYRGVLYPSFYDDIDLKIYSQGSNLKYDFVVKPYADVRQITFSYEGIEALTEKNGDLIAVTSIVAITEKKPVAYQFIDGKKVWIPCAYRVMKGRVSFDLPDGYDPCYELIIDPLLIFSTYSGSTADNWGSTATPAEHGQMYSAGATQEFNLNTKFPSTPGVFQTTFGGSWDIGILKYDSLGRNLLYASYLGGSLEESAHSLVVDSNNDLIVLGTTGSSDFATTDGAFDRVYNGGEPESQVYFYQNGADIFVARISSDGKVLKGSTFLGGSANDGLNSMSFPLFRNYGDGLRGDVIVDHNHNVYFSSVTASLDFPVVGSGTAHQGGGLDAVLVKLNPDLTDITFSMFIGGTGADAAHSVKLDDELNIYVAGGTTSSDFPVTANAFQQVLAGDVDGWLAEIDKSGAAILNATFTGKASYDQVFFIDLDIENNAYVYGQTTSSDFIKTPDTVFHQINGGQFIQKFSSDLSTLLTSTVFGSGRGEPDISPTAFLVNDCDNIFLAGWGGRLNNSFGTWINSGTQGLLITPGALKTSTTGDDLYFLVLNANMTKPLYATWLGGTTSSTHVDGGTSRFDKTGIVYHAVCSGCRSFQNQSTSDFPTTQGAHSRTNNSTNCNNLAFKLDLSSLVAVIQPNSVALDNPGLDRICHPDTLIFENLSVGGQLYHWDMGDGRKFSTANRNRFRHFYKQAGIYTVWLKAVDPGTCKVKDSTFVKITVDKLEATVSDDVKICQKNPTVLSAQGGTAYTWTTKDGGVISNLPDVSVSPEQKTVYYVDISRNGTDCVVRDSIWVDVVPLIIPAMEVSTVGECLPSPTITVTSSTLLEDGDQFYIDFGDGSTADTETAEHTYEVDGIYMVKLVTIREFCVYEETKSVPAFRLKVPNVITPEEKDGKNDTFKVLFGKEAQLEADDIGFKVSLTVYNRWGRKVYESNVYNNQWNGDDLEPGVYFFEVKVDSYSFCKSWLEIIR
jgi:hypothetical protein